MDTRRQIRQAGQDRWTTRLRHEQTIESIVSEMTEVTPDPTRQLDRFDAQLNRDVMYPPLEIHIDEQQFVDIQHDLQSLVPQDIHNI